ncbi:MAG: DNA internalization-related competence protein ComEC/Rec2 [Candidatus Sulfobium sp.]|jgi:competence protein ComEC
MPVFASFLAGDALLHLYRFFPLSALFLLVAASVCLCLKRKIFLLAVIVTGVLYAFLRLTPSHPPADIRNRTLSITGTFSSDSGVASSGTPFRTFTIESARDQETGREVDEMKGRQTDIFQDIKPDPDKGYELLFRTGGDKAGLNPGGWKSNRVYGKLVAYRETVGSRSLPGELNKLRDELNRYITNRFPGDGGALVSAVTTGEKTYLTDAGRESFAVTGLAHLLSISGTHFGLFSVILFGIFLFLLRRLPYRPLQRLTIFLTPPQAAALLCIPFMLMYLGISGGKVPAVRSFVMISLFLAGLLLGRKGFWLNSLFFAAFVLAVWDPAVILSLSFQFSFIAVLFIGFSVEKEDEKEGAHRDKGPRILSFFRSSAKLTVAAFLGTAPLAAYHFHLLPAIAPLSNLLVAPLIGFVLVPLSLFSAFSFLATGAYIFAPLVGETAKLCVVLVRHIAEIPFAALPVPSFPPALCIFFYAGFLLYLLLGKRKELLILPFVPFVVYALATGLAKKDLSVTFLDVGQGDSAVIELPDGKTVVVDTGRTGRETAAFLKFRGKKTIDAMVLTHIHPDHTGGYEYLMDRFFVKEIWDNGLIRYPEDMKALHRVLGRGDRVEAAGYAMTVLHPHGGFRPFQGSEYDGENNSSLVLKISGERGSFLFAGDIEEEAENDLAHLKGRLSSDIFKVPHHGSSTSADAAFLSLVSPSISVISVGKDNPFGHPGGEVLEKLAGSTILRTDRDGAVKITETTAGFRVKTCRESDFRETESLDGELKNLKLLFSSW